MTDERQLPPDPDWDDAALRACQSWIRVYRRGHTGSANRMRTRFADHLGRCAVERQRAGVGEPELLRAFTTAAVRGTCACGAAPADPAFDRPAEARR